MTQHNRKIGEAQVSTSIIVAAELRYGAAKKGLGARALVNEPGFATKAAPAVVPQLVRREKLAVVRRPC